MNAKLFYFQRFWFVVTLLLTTVGLIQIQFITNQCNLFIENERGIGYITIENNSTDVNETSCVKLELSEVSALWKFGFCINFFCVAISCFFWLVVLGLALDKDYPLPVLVPILVFGILAVLSVLLLVGLAESDTVRWNIGSTRAIITAMVWITAAVTVSFGQKLKDSLSPPPATSDAVGDLENPDSAAALEHPNTPPKEEDMEQAPSHLPPIGPNEPDILISNLISDIHDNGEMGEIEMGEPEIHLQSDKIKMEEPNIEMKETEILLQAEEERTRQVQR